MTDLESRLQALLTPNAEGLLPCPWCGEAKYLKVSKDESYHVFKVYCANCDALGPERCDAKNAIAAWNSRPLVRALVEAMRQRSHGYRYVWDVLSDRQKAEIGQWFERDDAKILALLDGKGET